MGNETYYTLSYRDAWIDLDRHAGGGITTIARFNRREVAPEKAWRQAVLLLGESAVINNDMAAAAATGDQEAQAHFENWVQATVRRLAADRDQTRLKAVLAAAESAAYNRLTAAFSQESNLDLEITGWQIDSHSDDYEAQFLVRVDLINPNGTSSEVFIVLPTDAGGWDAEHLCAADRFKPESWQPLPDAQ
jgi:hypothetical protein